MFFFSKGTREGGRKKTHTQERNTAIFSEKPWDKSAFIGSLKQQFMKKVAESVTAPRLPLDQPAVFTLNSCKIKWKTQEKSCLMTLMMKRSHLLKLVHMCVCFFSKIAKGMREFRSDSDHTIFNGLP